MKHDKQHQLLLSKNTDFAAVRIISNLYGGQKADAMVENQPTEEMVIRHDVRQGCILSPLLFNPYSKAIFRETLEDDLVCYMNYAENTVLLASNFNKTHNTF